MFTPILPLLEEGLQHSRTPHITDLGSGGGGPLLDLIPELRKKFPDLNFTLTDHFPNLPAFKLHHQEELHIKYRETPVDVRNIPEDLEGMRTLFLLLHHLKPQDAVSVLQNAVDTNSPIAVFEAQERSAASIIAMLLSPLSVLFTTPFIKPFSWGRLLFTYLIP
ncbi:hypothetical protein, partial [Longispora fulva]|uniref:hypothetical protein n=1 Tax=Longispora fulva TaxID=619741 RepID=UPI003640913B